MSVTAEPVTHGPAAGALALLYAQFIAVVRESNNVHHHVRLSASKIAYSLSQCSRYVSRKGQQSIGAVSWNKNITPNARA